MKKKYLKKMLAIMLASMTVSSTPGLVGAMKEESKKTIQEANSKIENHTLTTEEATNMLDELEEMANEDDEAKKEVAETLTKMIDQRVFDKVVKTKKSKLDIRTMNVHQKIVLTSKPPSKQTISQIIKIFHHCLDYGATKRNFVKSIQTMAKEKWLKATDAIEILTKCLEYGNDETKQKNYSETKQYVAKAIDDIFKNKNILDELTTDDGSKIMKLLKECFKDNETTIASAISSLVESSGGMELKDCLDTNEILNMLDESLKDDRSKVYVAKSINHMIAHHFFEGNLQQERILDMLRRCSDSYPAQKYVTDALSPRRDQENLCDKNSFDQCLTMLETCSENDDARLNVASAIYNMTFFDLINKNSRDKILNILHECSKKPEATALAISAMNRMTKQGLLNEKPMDETMLHTIELCSKNRRDTIDVINSMAEKDLLNQCQSDEVKRIVNAFVSCIDNNSYIISAYGYVRVNICQTITTMAMKNILNRCPKHQINLLVKRLIRIFNQYGTPEAIEAISAINEKNLITELDSDSLQLLISSLIYRFDDNRTAISATIAAIIRNSNVPGQLANSLPGLLANNNTQEAATIIISAMAENPETFNQFNHVQLRQILNLFKAHLENYLAGGNYEMVDRIFKVFRRCSEIDALKADVADIAEMLTYEDSFYQYLDQDSETPRLGNFLDTLTSCSSTQDADAKKKAVFAVAHVISHTGQTNKAISQIKQKIQQIIEMLEQSSTVDEAKLNISDIISLLGRRGFLQDLSHDQNSRLITALDNCLKYGNTRISAMTNVNQIQQDTATSVNAIFGDHDWMASFIEHLSTDDKARFFELADEARNAFQNAFKYM